MCWSLGKVVKAFKSADNLVGSVKAFDSMLHSFPYFVRPSAKIVCKDEASKAKHQD